MNSAITRLNATRSFTPDAASRALSWALAARCWRCLLSSLTREDLVDCFTRQLRRSDAASLRDRLQQRAHSRWHTRLRDRRVAAIARSLALELKIFLISSE
jgi:hypothetical protein